MVMKTYAFNSFSPDTIESAGRKYAIAPSSLSTHSRLIHAPFTPTGKPAESRPFNSFSPDTHRVVALRCVAHVLFQLILA